MMDLQKWITAQLKQIHPRVYLEVAPQDKVFPYLVYNLPSSDTPTYYLEDYILEIDVWDKPADGSTVTLQQLADDVDRRFNLSHYYSPDGWVARVFRIGRLMLPDPDPTIRRRQLRYQIKFYDGRSA